MGIWEIVVIRGMEDKESKDHCLCLPLSTITMIPCVVKGVGFRWESDPPGNWSLQPVVIGAVREVTNLPEPSMERIV